jgi:hypothetical protein
MKRFVLAISLLALASPAFASKEGVLALSSFRLESNGIGSSGKVIVAGKQNDKSQSIMSSLTGWYLVILFFPSARCGHIGKICGQIGKSCGRIIMG